MDRKSDFLENKQKCLEVNTIKARKYLGTSSETMEDRVYYRQTYKEKSLDKDDQEEVGYRRSRI